MWTYEGLMISWPDLFSNENAAYEIIKDPVKISSWQQEYRARLENSGVPTEWANIGIVLDDPYVLALRDLVRMPSGQLNGYIRLVNRADLSGGHSVVVLPVIDEHIILIRIFRHATRSWHLEIPRGFGEPGVLAEEQAKSEVSEEIGGKISDLIPLGQVHSNTGIEGQKVAMFLARLSAFDDPKQEEGINGIQTILIEEVEEMIATSLITDAFTITAIYQARLRNLL